MGTGVEPATWVVRSSKSSGVLGTGVRVEGINHVVHGDDVEGVVDTFAREGNILNVKEAARGRNR